MSEFLYTAKFIQDNFIITKYYIVDVTKDRYLTVTRDGTTVIFQNDLLKIAFSEKDAILLLINSYNSKIDSTPDYKVELMFQQRHIQNIYNRKFYK